jgi:long-chain fatty acid transport protein
LNFNNHNEETSMTKNNVLRATVMASALLTGAAWATDGYFPHGYGMKALGMGGASVAMTDNAFAGANNPATAAFSGNRYELGVNVFMPKRGASEGSGAPFVDSGSNTFLIPEFGYNTDFNKDVSGGVTVYGNGGMNTDYPAGGIQSLMGTGKTGVNLMQLIVAPTVAYKLNETSSIGVSPLLVYQSFKADGLGGFAGFSASPSSLSNNGSDTSTGVGVRFGYFGKLSNELAIGASYSPKVKMSKLDKYKGLFAGSGSFDIPENYALGLAFQVAPTVKLAVDYERINYSKVPAIGNPSANIMGCMGGDPNQCLGGSNGPGFGWTDVNVAKLGVEWAYSSNVTLRAGYNSTTNPVKSSDVTFNILAPGVVTKHYTLGSTYKLSKDSELTWAYMYAPTNSVSGTYLMNAMQPLGTQTIRMSQQSLGVQYGWKF